MLKDKQITTKVSEDERQLIIKAAKLIGLGQGAFCRSVSLERARSLIKRVG